MEGAESLPYRASGEERDVFALTVKQRVVPSYYAVRDYNYRTPSVDIAVESEIPGAFAGGVLEYGTHHKTPEEGKALAAARAEERRAGEVVYTGRSTVAALAPGARVTITGHPDLGPIFTGYLGSFLIAGAFLAISSFTSALTRNQVISFILSLVVCLFLILCGWPPVTDTP